MELQNRSENAAKKDLRSFTVRVAPEIYKSLRLVAAAEDESLNGVLNQAIEKYLKNKNIPSLHLD